MHVNRLFLTLEFVPPLVNSIPQLDAIERIRKVQNMHEIEL